MSSPKPLFQSSCSPSPLIFSPCSIHFWNHPQHVTGRKEVARIFIDKENLSVKQGSGGDWCLFCLFLANSLPSQWKRMDSEFSSGLGESFWSAGLDSLNCVFRCPWSGLSRKPWQRLLQPTQRQVNWKDQFVITYFEARFFLVETAHWASHLWLIRKYRCLPFKSLA